MSVTRTAKVMLAPNLGFEMRSGDFPGEPLSPKRTIRNAWRCVNRVFVTCHDDSKSYGSGTGEPGNGRAPFLNDNGPNVMFAERTTTGSC
jgi:hypothetical protein